MSLHKHDSPFPESYTAEFRDFCLTDSNKIMSSFFFSLSLSRRF